MISSLCHLFQDFWGKDYYKLSLKAQFNLNIVGPVQHHVYSVKMEDKIIMKVTLLQSTLHSVL